VTYSLLHYYNTPLYQRFITLYNKGQMSATAIPSLLWWHSSEGHVSPIATVLANSNELSDIIDLLLLAPTIVMGLLTSTVHCYLLVQ
jgi:hypothetical protein